MAETGTTPGNIFSIEGRAVLPGGIRPARIEIDPSSGRIARVLEPRGRADLLPGEKTLILPGLIDLHVHAREDSSGKQTYKEDFASAGAAAAHGGVTAFADMPNNPAPPIDDASYRAKEALARRSPVDVLLLAGIGPRTRPLSFPVPYKAFVGPSIGDLFFASEGQLREALARYRGSWVAFHAESPEVLERSKGRGTHEERRPPEAEVEAVRLAVALAGEYGLEAHICHISTAGGLEEVIGARRAGMAVTCEVTPHHLFFDLDSLARHPRPRYLQCNPPIRPREDRLALLEGLRRGDVDMIASDHAPHSLDENERGISGVPHLDTLGPFLSWLAGQGVPWEAIARASAASPGAVAGRFLGGKFGKIEEGAVASLTVLDPEKPCTVDRAALRTKAGWSPFEGMTFPGSVLFTIVKGKVLFGRL